MELQCAGLDKKVVHNNSNREFTDKEIELQTLGLIFSDYPKSFPLIEYITATEKLCQSLEELQNHCS